MKRTIRLTESDLHNMIAETVSQVLKEYGETPETRYQIGRAIARRNQFGLDGKEMADHFTPQQGITYRKRKDYADWEFDDDAMSDGYDDQNDFMDAVNNENIRGYHTQDDAIRGRASSIRKNYEKYQNLNPKKIAEREKANRKAQREKFRLSNY